MLTHVVGPHGAPPQSASAVHGRPSLDPLVHARNVGMHVPPGQSRALAHPASAFSPPRHNSTGVRRAIRSTLVGASADPNKVVAAGSVGSASGSKMGGSLRPSGVNEPRKAGPGMWMGTPVPATASSGLLPR